jgi:hypothetical protein
MRPECIFLTLTADELTDQRWPDGDRLTALLRKMFGQTTTLTWQDMPCEMARMFTDRVRAFMTTHIVVQHGRQKGIFGRVQHWWLRYESQVSSGATPGHAPPCTHAHACTQHPHTCCTRHRTLARAASRLPARPHPPVGARRRHGGRAQQHRGKQMSVQAQQLTQQHLGTRTARGTAGRTLVQTADQAGHLHAHESQTDSQVQRHPGRLQGGPPAGAHLQVWLPIRQQQGGHRL